MTPIPDTNVKFLINVHHKVINEEVVSPEISRGMAEQAAQKLERQVQIQNRQKNRKMCALCAVVFSYIATLGGGILIGYYVRRSN